MKSIQLPNDLQAYAQRKLWRQIGICAITEVFIFVFLLLLGDRIFSALGVFLQTCIYVLLFTFPILLTGLPWKLADRNWCGTVINVSIKTKTTYATEAQYLQNLVILTLKSPKGEILIKEVAAHNVQASRNGIDLKNVGIKAEHYLGEYAVGDEVYHFRGFPYPLVIGPNYKDQTTCIVCGNETASNKSHCWSCGHSLIKPK